MTDDLHELRGLASDFFETESVPNQRRWEEQHQVDRDLWNKAGERGLLCLAVPEEYGGAGGTFAHDAVVFEEQSRVLDSAFGNGVHSGIVAHYLVNYGSEEQKKKWLPQFVSGEMVGAIAMTEPGAGSDLQSLKTTAVADGGEYVINGSKTFITNGTHADLVVVVARTGGEGGKGLSLICVEPAITPGFSRGRVLEKIGTKGQDTRELFFEDMRVPKENLLGGESGEEGQGFIQLMQQLPQERLTLAVAAVAATEAVLRETIAYVKEREAFGRSIAKFQNTKFELAECVTETFAVRTLVDHCIEAHVAGKLDDERASMAKYYASDKQNEGHQPLPAAIWRLRIHVGVPRGACFCGRQGETNLRRHQRDHEGTDFPFCAEVAGAGPGFAGTARGTGAARGTGLRTRPDCAEHAREVSGSA